MKYNHKHVIFELKSNSVYHGYTLHKHHFLLNFGQHAKYSHNSEHAHINLIITKTYYIQNFYQHTCPTYDSMGASDKDMQRGTILVFGLNLSEP